MRNKKYDFFNGGLNDFIKDLQTKKKQIELLENNLLPILDDQFRENVVKEAQTVDDLVARVHIINFNRTNTLSDTKIQIKNVSQEATYSEFGTGAVGHYNPKHPNREIHWKHMVNMNRNYGLGWVYRASSGRLIRTHGVPSNPVYWRSSRNVRNNIKETISKESKKVLT